MKKLLILMLVVVAIALFVLTKRTFVDITPIIFGINIQSNTVTNDKYQSEISISTLRGLNIDSEALSIEEELAPGSNYKRYIASYISEGNKIYGLLTVPNDKMPENGYSAIVFNHGYIPPKQYVTTEKYVAYVDYLAKNGFVVFKIDLRGHGNSEGSPVGSYFSAGYTVDAISALKSLQKLDYVNSEKIGIWGHSMAGNLVLRTLLVEEDFAVGVIWSGAVYSYEDFAKYRLNDSSYVRREPDSSDPHNDARVLNLRRANQVQQLRDDSSKIDFKDAFWSSVSLTQNLEYLNVPLQIHHAADDLTVNVGYSRDLEKVLIEKNKEYEYYEYIGGGHNIESPFFEEAMERTVEFFKKNL